MSTLIEEQHAPPEEPGRRHRRWWPWVASGLVLALLVAFGVVAVTYAHSYQPLYAGSGGGPVTDQTIRETTDGLENTNYVLVGPTGTRGTVEFAVENDGPFAARLLGLTAEEAPGPITGLRWAPLDCGGYGCQPGLLRESRPVPVAIPAHGSVYLLVTVTQPRCNSGDRGMSIDGFLLRWSALGVHHLFDVNLSPGAGPMLPIYLCPTSRIAELSH